MANIGKMSVLLSARTGRFNSAMRKSGKVVKRFAAGVAGLASRMVKIGAVAGIAAAAGLVLLTKRAFTAIDVNKKLADSIGISTEELAGFQLAANLTGSSSGALNKSLQFFVKNLGEAKAGIGEARLNLEKLGLSLDDITDAKVGEGIKLLADKMKEIEDPARKAAIANALFGRAGKELLNFLALGRKGLEKIKKETQAFGTSLSDVDSAKIEAANDSITRMKEVFDGLGKQISLRVAPFITDLGDRMRNFLLSGSSVGKIVGGAFDIVKQSIAGAANAFSLIEAGGKLTLAVFGSIVLGAKRVGLAIVKAIVSAVEISGRALLSFGNSTRLVFEKIGVGIALRLGNITEEVAKFLDKAFEAQARKRAKSIEVFGASQEFKEFIKRAEADIAALQADVTRNKFGGLDAIDDFLKGTRFKSALSFMDRIAKKAQEMAESMVKTEKSSKKIGAKGLGTDRDGPKGLARTGQFRQVRAGEVAIGGPAGAKSLQRVKDPEALEVLKAILAKIGVSGGTIDSLVARSAAGI